MRGREFLCFVVFLHEVEVNLIITNYYIPSMTGYDLLRKIKARFGFYCRYPEKIRRKKVWNLRDKHRERGLN
jgi:CheY-like chemotaxis protein